MDEIPSNLKRALRSLRRQVGSIAFERRMKVETVGSVGDSELGYTDDRLESYEPSGWRTLQQILPKSQVSEQDVFIDLGSGMGRMVLRAAEYPFRRVVGVEMSAELHAIAVENLKRCRHRRLCADVEFVCADALEYDFPNDATVVFLYNPFRAELFDEALSAVFRSVDRSPRRVRILYRNPVEHQRLMASGRVRVLGEWKHSVWRGWPREVSVRTYEVLPLKA